MKAADTNDDSVVSWQEFLSFGCGIVQGREIVQRSLRKAFEIMDTSGDGELSRMEVRSAITRNEELRSLLAQGDNRDLTVFLDPTVWDSAFVTMDLDGNDALSWDELRQFAQQRAVQEANTRR